MNGQSKACPPTRGGQAGEAFQPGWPITPQDHRPDAMGQTDPARLVDRPRFGDIVQQGSVLEVERNGAGGAEYLSHCQEMCLVES